MPAVFHGERDVRRSAGCQERAPRPQPLRLHQYADPRTGLDGDLGAGADGDADVGLRERGRVVDAVADHRDDARPSVGLRLPLQHLHVRRLARRRHVGKHLPRVDAHLR